MLIWAFKGIYNILYMIHGQAVPSKRERAPFTRYIGRVANNVKSNYQHTSTGTYDVKQLHNSPGKGIKRTWVASSCIGKDVTEKQEWCIITGNPLVPRQNNKNWKQEEQCIPQL